MPPQSPHIEQARALFWDSAAQPLALVDADGRLRQGNPAFQALAGPLPAQGLALRDWLAAGWPLGRGAAQAWEAWSQLDPGQTGGFLAHMQRQDGGYGHLEFLAQPLEGGWRLLTLTDLAASAQAQRLFQAAFQSGPICQVLTSLPEGRIIDVNDTFERLTGYRRDEVVGRLATEMEMWLDPKVRDPLTRQVLAQGRVRDARVWLRRKDGMSMEFLVSMDLVMHDGRPALLMGASELTADGAMARALLESEAKFRILTETTASGIFIIQGEHYRYMNPAGISITGRTWEELERLKFWEVIHPDFQDLVRQRGLARQEGGQVPNHYEFKINRPDGVECWVDFTAGPLDYLGRPALLGTVFDITKRKQAEARLLLDGARLEALVELGRLGGQEPLEDILRFAVAEAVRQTGSVLGYAGWVDGQGGFRLAARHVSGLPYIKPWAQSALEDLEACQPWSEALHRRRPVLDNQLEASGRQEGRLKGQSQLLRHLAVPLLEDGRVVALAGLANKPEAYDDSDARLLSLFLDAVWKTARHQRAMEALRRSEERFRSLTDNAPDIIFSLDMLGTLTYVNPAWQRILGHPPDQMLGKPFTDFVRPQDVRNSRRRFREIREGSRNILATQGILLDTQGQEHHFTISGGPNRDARSRFVGMVGLLRDVTAQVELEGQLRHAQKMEALGTLAGGVAHEFNNVLMAVRGYTQLVSLTGELSENTCGYLGKIDQSCQRAAQLTRKMLTFTRLEVGDKDEVDVGQVAQGVWQLLAQTTGPLVDVAVEVEPGLPPVLGNASQLEQVLFNLALNARDAIGQEGRIIISVGLARRDQAFAQANPWAKAGDYVILEVADTGLGMGPEVLERIFDPFFTTKEPGKGTGLGLSVAYSIVKGHQGHLSAESKPGQGSRFTVHLPALQGPGGKRSASSLGETPSGQGERLLVVDDEPELREIAAEMLGSFGYLVETACQGQEGLDFYLAALEADRPFDLVILDLAMPVMDGLTCLDKIRQRHPLAKVLIATGHGPESLDQGPGQGQALLLKPYDMAQLLQAVWLVLHPGQERP